MARQLLIGFRDVLHSLRARYSVARVLLLIGFILFALWTLVALDAPPWVWGAVGFVVGVLVEDTLRGLGRWVHRQVRQSSPPIRRDDVVMFAGTTWKMLASEIQPGGMRFGDIDIQVDEDDLFVPAFVSDAVTEMEDILSRHPMPVGIVFENSPCLIVTHAPRHRREHEEAGLYLIASRSTYFTKVLCRGNIPPQVLGHLRSYWNTSLPDPEDIRLLISHEFPTELNPLREGFHPLRHPNLGIAVAPIIYDGGKVYTAWARRSSHIATNPGRLGVPVNEGIVPSDQAPNSRRVDLRRAFQRGFHEETGASVGADEVFGIGGVVLDVDGGGTVDRNGVHCGGGVIVFGWARVAMSPREYMAMLPRDRFEVDFVETCELEVPDIADILANQRREDWFPPSVLAYGSALEHVQQGGFLKLGRALERKWRE